MITWKSPHVFLSGSLKWNPPTLKKKQTTKSRHVQYTKVQKKSHNSAVFFQPSPIDLRGIYCNIPCKKHQKNRAPPSTPQTEPAASEWPVAFVAPVTWNQCPARRPPRTPRCDGLWWPPTPKQGRTTWPNTKKKLKKIGCTSSVKKMFKK